MATLSVVMLKTPGSKVSAPSIFLKPLFFRLGFISFPYVLTITLTTENQLKNMLTLTHKFYIIESKTMSRIFLWSSQAKKLSPTNALNFLPFRFLFLLSVSVVVSFFIRQMEIKSACASPPKRGSQNFHLARTDFLFFQKKSLFNKEVK